MRERKERNRRRLKGEIPLLPGPPSPPCLALSVNSILFGIIPCADEKTCSSSRMFMCFSDWEEKDFTRSREGRKGTSAFVLARQPRGCREQAERVVVPGMPEEDLSERVAGGELEA